ncbi:hypothetical protein DWY01_01920 [Eubacterium sp. AF22-8LB]|jgi:hypothetical protein|uniref:hypothetical protein n=1 Tax=Eubacterium sp. AF22-8LB TaxID=2292232 RepID=UPI000E52686D|nr:hypothetical protein [Eubacterium sp. AF22-8LB]RGS32151.1 hypothetical protein DWY01_01920 [Eubacterium sp. AF22-8LB]
MNQKDMNELLELCISEKDIKKLSKKGYTKTEIINIKKKNDEIKKGVTILDVISEILTWLLS